MFSNLFIDLKWLQEKQKEKKNVEQTEKVVPFTMGDGVNI